MTNWMQDRSKYQYYDQYGEETSPPPPTKWYEVLGFVILVILLPYLYGLLMFLGGLGLIWAGFQSIAQYTMEHGNLKFPFLAYAGVALAFILATAVSNYHLRFADHPVLFIFSIIFIALFSIAPLTGLAYALWEYLSVSPKGGKSK